MFNILKDDDNHQYLIDNKDLFSIEIMLDKSDALEALLLASKIENGSVCLLVNKEALQQYNLQIPLSSLSKLNIPRANKYPDNYLINEFLLFLNSLLKVTDDKVLLNAKKLEIIYKKICYLVNNINKDNNIEKLKILLKVVDEISINVKNKYSINEIFTIYNSTDFLYKENLIICPSNLGCVIENANGNKKILNNLGIKLEKQKQKTKA